MDIAQLLHYLPLLLSGFFLTIELVAAAVICGFILASVFTYTLYRQNKWLNAPIKLLMFVIRGTPLLVQFFLIYFGLSQFDSLRHSFLWGWFVHPFACALTALGINTACYTTELFYGAMQRIPAGEYEACATLGMSKYLAFRRVLFPRALINVLPAYSNEVIMIIKGSSLASTITLLDLMGATRLAISNTYDVLQFYLVAGVLYLLLNSIIMWLFHRLEKKSHVRVLQG